MSDHDFNAGAVVAVLIVLAGIAICFIFFGPQMLGLETPKPAHSKKPAVKVSAETEEDKEKEDKSQKEEPEKQPERR